MREDGTMRSPKVTWPIFLSHSASRVGERKNELQADRLAHEWVLSRCHECEELRLILVIRPNHGGEQASILRRDVFRNVMLL